MVRSVCRSRTLAPLEPSFSPLPDETPDEVLDVCMPVLAEFTLYAEPNRRIKVPENVPEALRPWYAAKGFYFEKAITDFDLIFSPALAEEVKAGFQRLKPLYRYLLNLQPGED